MAAALEGDRRAIEQLRDLFEGSPDPEGTMSGAMFLGIMGEIDDACAWMERAIEGGCFYPQIFRFAAFDSIRGDARFKKPVSRAEERRQCIADRFGERIERLERQLAV